MILGFVGGSFRRTKPHKVASFTVKKKVDWTPALETIKLSIFRICLSHILWTAGNDLYYLTFRFTGDIYSPPLGSYGMNHDNWIAVPDCIQTLKLDISYYGK